MSPHARRKDHTTFDSGQFTNLFYAAIVVALLIVVLVIYNLHTKMTKLARKRM